MRSSAKRQRAFRKNNPTAARAIKTRYMKKRGGLVGKTRHLRERYGISLRYFNILVRRQGGGCAICTLGFVGTRGGLSPCVDHNHETGKVRGILHRKCNAALGVFEDSVYRLDQTIDYLEKHRAS